MNVRHSHFIVLSVLLSCASGCVRTRTLPSRSTPQRVRPHVTISGRMAVDATDVPVVLDGVDGPTRVSRVTGSVDVQRESSYRLPTYQSHSEYRCNGATCGYVTVVEYGSQTTTHRWTERVRTTEPVCPSTPCTAHLPPGPQTLVFHAPDGESDASVVLTGAVLLRHAPTLREPGLDLWPATIAAWLLGALAAVLGPLIATYEQSSLGPDREPIGWGITAGGGGLIALGAALLTLNEETLVTPGTTGQWALGF